MTPVCRKFPVSGIFCDCGEGESEGGRSGGGNSTGGDGDGRGLGEGKLGPPSDVWAPNRLSMREMMFGETVPLQREHHIPMN